jgi:hypothetical protein
MFLKLKVVDYNYYCRIDIDEISIYVPAVVKKPGKNPFQKDVLCTNIVMKNGSSLLIEKTCDEIDEILKEHGTVIE